jgi:hypothetical protein
MKSPPDFVSAVSDFRNLLMHMNHPSKMRWTFFEDYAWVRQSLYVHHLSLDSNLDVTECIYLRHPMRDLGVELSLVAASKEVSYCTLWIPESEREAELRLLSGLKLSVPTRLLVAHLVEDASVWPELKAAESCAGIPSPVDELQRRAELLALVQ